MITSFVFALFATFGFCILFHVPLRCMLPTAAIGGMGWFAYQLLMELGLGITVRFLQPALWRCWQTYAQDSSKRRPPYL